MPFILCETTPQDIVRQLLYLPATKCINYFTLFYIYAHLRMYRIRVHTAHTMIRGKASPKGMYLCHGIPTQHTRIVTRGLRARVNTYTIEY